MTPRARSILNLGIETGVWVLIVAGMWVYSHDFDRPSRLYARSLVEWPRAVMTLLLVSVLMSFALRLRDLLRQPAEAAPEHGSETLGVAARLRILGTFALPLIYLWLLPRTGYYATTPFFLAGYMYVFGQRRLRNLIVTTVSVYVVILLIFSKWLFVPLPTGDWPGFYEFSNWLLGILGSG
jgi:hypothetical protein